MARWTVYLAINYGCKEFNWKIYIFLQTAIMAVMQLLITLYEDAPHHKR